VPHPRRLTALLIAGLALIGAGATARAAAPTSAATAAAVSARDVSWPQCGGGALYPSGRQELVVVGLTDGLALTTNPCLGAQLAWARRHADVVSAYTMATRPTARQLAAAVAGPLAACASRDTRCALRNAGAREADHALATLRARHVRTSLLWVDVEPRPRQPWSAHDTAGNAAVLAGIDARLRAARVQPGYYSTPALWRQVAGGWRPAAHPEWVAVGRVTAGRLAAGCSTRFAGGQPWVTQGVWRSGGVEHDVDHLCPRGRAGLGAMALLAVTGAVPVSPTASTAPVTPGDPTPAPATTTAPAATATASPSPTASPAASASPTPSPSLLPLG